jgi:putative ATPase
MSSELFEKEAVPVDELHLPLAERMRPSRLEEFFGQEHLVGEGKILRTILESESKQSLVLWGPPGSGKTTLAHMIASHSKLRFVPFSAVLSGIKEVRAVMAEAAKHRERSGKPTLLFVDEIHRFNKAQQDAFLPFVERGDILLIGATTENPSFEVNGALLSRVRTVVLEPLGSEDVQRLLRRALEDEQRGMGGTMNVSGEALAAIVSSSDGDARRALTMLETVCALVEPGEEVTTEILAAALQKKTVRYDKSGEEHFNQISALHKSVRNSDADAALYWLTRMMEAGEDGNYLARRLIRMASEDIGLADVRALSVCLDAAEAFHRLGYPEGKLALAQATVYLARTRKSNTLYVALSEAEKDVRETAAEPVPLHLRNASTRLMKEVGYGKGYRYAHDDPAARDEMSCLPESLLGRKYFHWSAPDSAQPGPKNAPE